jgi:hypothetical protein
VRWLVLMAAVSLPASAQTIVIQPFHNRCFDAAALAARLRAQLPAVEIVVGPPPSGAHQAVRVSGDDKQVTVRLTVKNERQQLVGSDERLLPLGEDCAAAVETAALILARAATPLSFRPPPPPRRAPRPSEIRPAPSEIRPPPPSEIRPTPAPEVIPSPIPERVEVRPPPSPPPEKPPSEIRPAARPRVHHRLEIDLAAMWAFPLDAGSSTPAGEISVGWRWRRSRLLHLGVGVRGGVSGEWSVASSFPGGTVQAFARRIPLSAELRLDIEVARAFGVVRLAVGPQAVVWVARAEGLPRPGSSVFAQPGAFVRASYRLELGPVVLTAGVALEAAFVRDDLTVGGLGRVTQTPIVHVLPFVGAGVGFF